MFVLPRSGKYYVQEHRILPWGGRKGGIINQGSNLEGVKNGYLPTSVSKRVGVCVGGWGMCRGSAVPGLGL